MVSTVWALAVLKLSASAMAPVNARCLKTFLMGCLRQNVRAFGQGVEEKQSILIEC
jgi:hypothetical protein